MTHEFEVVERSRFIGAAPNDVWRLMTGPEAWSLRQDRFAFDVDIAGHARARVVLSAIGGRPGTSVYLIHDDVPGHTQSLHLSGPPATARRLLSMSAVQDGQGTSATIATSYLASRGPVVRAEMKSLLIDWLASLRDVAEGSAPHPARSMPARVRRAFTPAGPVVSSRPASASVDIAAPASEVWEVIYAPESARLIHPACVGAGVVPGTPARQVGEMQFFVYRDKAERLTTRVVLVTELDSGRSAVIADTVPPHVEMVHQITPHDRWTRLELTERCPAKAVRGNGRAYVRQVSAALQAMLDRYKTLSEERVTQA